MTTVDDGGDRALLGVRPPRYLAAGDLLVSDITGLSELRQTFTC